MIRPEISGFGEIHPGSVAGGPAALRYRLGGLASAERPLLTLQRLLALWRTGGFSRSLHPREARAGRWLLMLRARDAVAVGADQRQIAKVLLSGVAGEPRWRTHSPSKSPEITAEVWSERGRVGIVGPSPSEGAARQWPDAPSRLTS